MWYVFVSYNTPAVTTEDKTAFPANIGIRNLGKHHVYCNRFYKKRTAYFYQRAVNLK